MPSEDFRGLRQGDGSVGLTCVDAMEEKRFDASERVSDAPLEFAIMWRDFQG